MKTALHLIVAAMATAMTWPLVLEAQTLTISASGILTWQENGTQQVVVSTESLAGLWAPLGQTISRTPDGCSLAIELARPSQFFRLKPGAQFRDEFDGSHEPWDVTFVVPAEASKHTFTYTNGALRIQGASDVTDGRLYLQPPAFARTNVADFHISLDVIDWPDTGTEQIIGIFARFNGSNAYIAELWRHCRYSAGMTVLNIWDGAGGHWTAVNVNADSDYRLVFSGATNRLLCSLYDVGDLQTSVSSVSITNSTFRTGTVGLWCSREYGPGPYGITIDNFTVTGTNP
jgi:hypothetical protein